MATATQNDNSDLLILSDNDAENGTNIVENNNTELNSTKETDDIFTFDDFDIKEETPEVKTDTIDELWNSDTSSVDTLDFWSDLSIEENIVTDEISFDEPKIEKANNDISPALDMSDFNVDLTEVPESINEISEQITDTIEEPILDITDSPDVSLDSNDTLTNNEEEEESILDITGNNDSIEDIDNETLNTDESILEIEDTNPVWSMVDIIDRAMNDMNYRLNDIKVEKGSEESDITESKEQIANFEAKVTIAEEKLAELASEEAMINKNTKSLERMKASNVATELKAETSTKVHNVKRKKAA